MNIDPRLPELLEPWYKENKRDLPWRKDRDPYHIWISEIMLQQTRVEAVKGYYTRFISELPQITDLANCPDDTLNKLWEGLGYYSRAKNLKRAAKQIVTQYNGAFPSDHSTLLSLPGIGEYTAGAIASIAFSQPKAAVDGNVMRVISRILNDNTPIDSLSFRKEVRVALEHIYPEDAGSFTQALMELGATICGPNKEPACQLCPCKAICTGYLSGNAKNLPTKSPKKEKRSENITLWILECDGKYAISQRDSVGLLANLWQFPNESGLLSPEEAIKYLSDKGIHVSDILMQLDKVHVFTHIRWNMRGYYLKVRKMNEAYRWMTKEEIDASIPLPTAFRQFWIEVL